MLFFNTDAALQLVLRFGSCMAQCHPPPQFFFNVLVHAETTSALNHRGRAGKMWIPRGQSLIINLLERHQQQLNAAFTVHCCLVMGNQQHTTDAQINIGAHMRVGVTPLSPRSFVTKKRFELAG